MKKEDVFPAYKTLVRMKDLVDNLDDALKKKDFERAGEIKKTLIELQRGLDKLL